MNDDCRDSDTPTEQDRIERIDRIEKIVIDYRRISKIKPDVVPEGATWAYVKWDYSERLTIDRKTETLEYARNIGTGCRITNRYEVEGGISTLLDDINSTDLFEHIEGNPPDAFVNPHETRNYKITVSYLHIGKRVIKGTFDKNGLPDYFDEFIEDILDFIRFYGLGEMVDSNVFGKALRRQTDLIFCNLIFEEGGKNYCYLTDDDTLNVGDLVVVPAGNDNHRSVALIESIEYHSAEEAPFPMDKIKKVIEKYDEDFDEDEE